MISTALQSASQSPEKRALLESALKDFQDHARECAAAAADDWVNENRNEIFLDRLRKFSDCVKVWFANAQVSAQQRWDYSVTSADLAAVSRAFSETAGLAQLLSAETSRPESENDGTTSTSTIVAGEVRLPVTRIQEENVDEPALGHVVAFDEKSGNAVVQLLGTNELRLFHVVSAVRDGDPDLDLLQYPASFAYAAASSPSDTVCPTTTRGHTTRRDRVGAPVSSFVSLDHIHVANSSPASSSFAQYSSSSSGVCKCYPGATGANCEIDISVSGGRQKSSVVVWAVAVGAVLFLVGLLFLLYRWLRKRRMEGDVALSKPANPVGIGRRIALGYYVVASRGISNRFFKKL